MVRARSLKNRSRRNRRQSKSHPQSRRMRGGDKIWGCSNLKGLAVGDLTLADCYDVNGEPTQIGNDCPSKCEQIRKDENFKNEYVQLYNHYDNIKKIIATSVTGKKLCGTEELCSQTLERHSGWLARDTDFETIEENLDNWIKQLKKKGYLEKAAWRDGLFRYDEYRRRQVDRSVRKYWKKPEVMKKIKGDLEKILPKATAKRKVEFDMIYDPVFYLSSGLIELLPLGRLTDLAKKYTEGMSKRERSALIGFEEAPSLKRLEDNTGEEKVIGDEFLNNLKNIKNNYDTGDENAKSKAISDIKEIYRDLNKVRRVLTSDPWEKYVTYEYTSMGHDFILSLMKKEHVNIDDKFRERNNFAVQENQPAGKRRSSRKKSKRRHSRRRSRH